MAKRFRVIKPAHKCQTPIEAVQLAEDMEKILTALHCIERVAPESIAKDRNKGWDDRPTVIHALKDWYAFARQRLRTEFLKVDKSD